MQQRINSAARSLDETVSVRQRRLVFGGLMLAMVTAALDQNIVNTALPSVVSDLGGLAHLSWIVTAFMLTSTATTPMYGKLSDMYGRRRLFVVAILVFLLGSTLCGLARSMTELILFRGLQGLGAGGLMTLAQASIGDLVPPRERGRYQGLFTGAFAISSVAGPLLGGVLTTQLSWRWVFYVNLPVGALALALILAGMRGTATRRQHKPDYEGALLLTGATTALLLVLSWGGSTYSWLSPVVIGLLFVAIGLGTAFVQQERRASEPIIDPKLFRNPVFARCVAASGMMSFAMLGALVFVPLYFQLVLHMTPTEAGMMLLPQIVGMMTTSVLGGQLVSTTGRLRPFLLAGVGLEALGLCGIAVLATIDAPAPWFGVGLLALGMGMGMGMPNVMTALQNAVQPGEMGAATSAMAFIRALGGALGVAVAGGVMGARLRGLLSETMPVAEVQDMLDRGIAQIASLGGDHRALVEVAYRHSISTSMLVNGAMMALAFVLVIALPVQTLRGRAETAAAE